MNTMKIVSESVLVDGIDVQRHNRLQTSTAAFLPHTADTFITFDRQAEQDDHWTVDMPMIVAWTKMTEDCEYGITNCYQSVNDPDVTVISQGEPDWSMGVLHAV